GNANAGLVTVPEPILPGERGNAPVVRACVYEVELDEPGIHTRRHFGGILETHAFFSREAVHAALFDLWYRVAPDTYAPDVVPYYSTPLFAHSPAYVTLKYASPAGWVKTDPRRRDLTVGTVQALQPSTRLRGAVWGNAAALPELFVGRA